MSARRLADRLSASPEGKGANRLGVVAAVIVTVAAVVFPAARRVEAAPVGSSLNAAEAEKSPTPAPVVPKASAPPSEVKPKPTTPPAEAKPTTAPAKRYAPSGEALITLGVPPNTPIEQVLMKIKSASGVNVMAVGGVRGQKIPGLMLKDVPVEEALKQIAAQKDWVVYRKGDDYFISDRATYEKTVLRTQVVQRVIRTRNISADDARQAVERMITPNVGHIQSDARTNQVIVTDLLPVVEAIERTIRLLDQKVYTRVFTIKNADLQTVMDVLQEYKSAPGRLQMIPKMRQIIAEDTYENIQRMEVMVDILDRGPEMRVYDLNNIDYDAKNLQELEQYLTDQIITEGAYLKFDPQNGVMILIDLPSVHEKVKKILEAVDRPARQVYIQADIVETSYQHTFELGTELIWADDLLGAQELTQPSETGASDQQVPAPSPGIQQTAQSAEAIDISKALGFRDITAEQLHRIYPIVQTGAGGFALDYISRHVRLAFAAVMQDSETRVLAQPRLLVKNRQPADFTDGGTIPYVTTTYYGGGYYPGAGYPGGYYGGYVPSVGMGSVPTGVTLSVDPSIMNNGLIELRVTLTNVSGDLRDVKSYDRIVQVPQTSNQTINTVLVVPDGQTRVIGGMIENRESESISGVPFLKDIPVLGPVLFGKKSRNPVRRRTLLMFITPTIVQEQARRYAVPPDEDEKTPPTFYEQASWSAAAVKRAVEAAIAETEAKYPGFEFPPPEAGERQPQPPVPTPTLPTPPPRVEQAPTTAPAALRPSLPEAKATSPPLQPLMPQLPEVPVLRHEPPPAEPTTPTKKSSKPDRSSPEDRATTPTAGSSGPSMSPSADRPTSETFPATGTVMVSPGPPPIYLSARRPSDLPPPRPVRPSVASQSATAGPPVEGSVETSGYELIVIGNDGRAVAARPSGETIASPRLGTVEIPFETLAAVATPAPTTRKPGVRRTPLRRTPPRVTTAASRRTPARARPTPRTSVSMRQAPPRPTPPFRAWGGGSRPVYPSTAYGPRPPVSPPRNIYGGRTPIRR